MLSIHRNDRDIPDTADAAYREEKARLDETLEEIAQQTAAIGPAYYGDDYLEQVLDARRDETRRRLALLAGEPYFGRLDFADKGRAAPMPLYIGKRGMDRRDTGEPYVIDWRAPVASLFYSFTGGDEPVSYEAPDGVIEGEVHLKRNLSIRDRELQRVVDSYVRGGDNLGLSDEFLLYRLGERKDNRLRDIVSTIQAEQDRIIRAPRDAALLIQGAAGSGKTTVALHRLAFLLYQYQGQIRADRMIIFAPNAMFLDYISGVLPELGVGDVVQTTFAAWALETLGDDVALAQDGDDASRFAPGADAGADGEPATAGRLKGSLGFMRWLDGQIAAYERRYLPEADFEPWPGTVLSAEQIRDWFRTEYRHYPLAPRRERLTARLQRWLEMRLNEIADPKLRKDRSKTGRAKLRAFAGKLPSTDAAAVYKAILEGTDGEPFLPPALRAATIASLKRGVVRLEDLPALVRIRQSFNGPAARGFDHVVIDEAQDASPFQLAVLASYMKEPSFTILGDLAQGIHAYRGIHRWEELAAAIEPHPAAYHELRISYRSTLEIIEFANRIIPFTGTGLPAAQPVFRSGEPVEIERAADAGDALRRMAAFIRDSLDRGMRTVAVIGRTDADCAAIAEGLRGIGVEAQLIAADQGQYRGGVSVVPVHLSKGLEFDAVLLDGADDRRYPAASQDAKLLYVGCTRALHRLKLLHEGTLTPMVAEPAMERM